MERIIPEFSLELAVLASIKAGNAIMNIYRSDELGIGIKADQSPITIADKHSNQVIHDVLFKTGLPVLSEEDCDIQYPVRARWELFWMVDPLDGTKEFISKSGDFTVNIALIYKCEPILGVIYVPVTGELYFSLKGKGAFKSEISEPIEDAGFQAILEGATKINASLPNGLLTIVASKSHGSEETNYFVRKHFNDKVGNYINRGSSLKLCLLAEGKAQLYPRFAGTMEWDTAAGHAILNEAGGTIVLATGAGTLEYNKKDLLNPYFVAVSDRSLVKVW